MMCEREPQAVAAGRSSTWPEELRRHVELCTNCQDALLVSRFLAEDAQTTGVPASGLVWFKSQLRLRREAVERSERPLLWGQRVAAAIAAIGMVWASAWAAGANTPLAAALIGSCVVLALTAGGLLFAARNRK